MVLDLHVEGSAPVTLLVRDESRSTRSTSGNRETTTSTTTRSHSRSPVPPSPPSLREQMSEEEEEEELRERLELSVAEYHPSNYRPRKLSRKSRQQSNSDPSLDLSTEDTDGVMVQIETEAEQRSKSNTKSLPLQIANAEFPLNKTNSIKNGKANKQVYSQSFEDPAHARSFPLSILEQSSQRWSQSLTAELASIGFIDNADDDESAAETEEAVTVVRRSDDDTAFMPEEDELFMELEEDMADMSEAFPVVFTVPKGAQFACFDDDFLSSRADFRCSGSAESSPVAQGSSGSNNNGRRHLLTRQAKVESDRASKNPSPVLEVAKDDQGDSGENEGFLMTMEDDSKTISF